MTVSILGNIYLEALGILILTILCAAGMFGLIYLFRYLVTIDSVMGQGVASIVGLIIIFFLIVLFLKQDKKEVDSK